MLIFIPLRENHGYTYEDFFFLKQCSIKKIIPGYLQFQFRYRWIYPPSCNRKILLRVPVHNGFTTKLQNWRCSGVEISWYGQYKNIYFWHSFNWKHLCGLNIVNFFFNLVKTWLFIFISHYFKSFTFPPDIFHQSRPHMVIYLYYIFPNIHNLIVY